MCDFWKNPRLEMTMAQFVNALKLYPKIKMVRFTGGEPLLHEQITDFVSICHDQGLKTSIITNGLRLEEKLPVLADSGLDQIVISVDSCSQQLHDELRGTPGLFNRICSTLNHINALYPKLRTRINTVVSEKNIHNLADLADWVDLYNIDQWSVIPIKRKESPEISLMSVEEYTKYYRIFQEKAKTCHAQLMGYSDNWVDCIEDYLYGKEKIHPKEKCNLTKAVAFYDPFSDHFYPCNCVPHRKMSFKNADEEIKWYYENGCLHCDGCEPLNAWCSDHPDALAENIFNF